MTRQITRQEKEDFLSLMYETRRKKNQVIKSDLMREMGIPFSRITKITEELLEEGYLVKDNGRKLFLTPMGLSRGQEYLERKRCLTEFLRMVSGVDESIAKENACVIEHQMDDRILTGIRTFMESRHLYSYSMKGSDLNLMFPEGTRKMPIAFYKKGSMRPRILSEEYDQFRKKAEVVICSESYLYLTPEDPEMMKKEVFYFYDGNWIRARKEGKGFGILTEGLDCTLRRNDKLSEGMIRMAVLDHPEEEIKEEKICILTVSLI